MSECRIPRHPLDTPPWGVLLDPSDFPERRRILRQVLDEAGVQLGEHDRAVSDVLAAAAGVTPVTVASWLLRAYDAGRAARPVHVTELGETLSASGERS